MQEYHFPSMAGHPDGTALDPLQAEGKLPGTLFGSERFPHVFVCDGGGPAAVQHPAAPAAAVPHVLPECFAQPTQPPHYHTGLGGPFGSSNRSAFPAHGLHTTHGVTLPAPLQVDLPMPVPPPGVAQSHAPHVPFAGTAAISGCNFTDIPLPAVARGGGSSFATCGAPARAPIHP